MRAPWKSIPPPAASAVVIAPYHPDAPSPRSARLRRIATISLVAFCFIYGFLFALIAPFLLVAFAVPIVILILLAVWALPDARVAPVKPLEYLFFAFVICLVLWPNYLAIALPGLPWITLSRLAAFPMIFVLLICLSTSKEFRRELMAAYKNIPILPISVALFVAVQIASIVFSKQKLDSIQKLSIVQVYWTGMFVAASYVFLKPGRVERWSSYLWIMTIPIGLIGIRENQIHHVIWAGHIPSFLKIEDKNLEVVLRGIFRAYTNIYRVQSTFGTSLGLGEYLSLTLPFVIHYAAGNYSPRTKLLAALSIPFILYITLISGSRLGVLGFGLSCLLYLFVWAFLRWRRERGGLVAPAIVLSYPAIFAAALAASLLIGKIRVKVWGGGASQVSTDARVTQVHMGIPLILKNPFGYGIGQGAQTLGFYTPGGILTIDTYYLLIALDYGVIGFIVYYGMLCLYLYFGGKYSLTEKFKDRELYSIIPASIALINFVIIKSAFSQTDNHPLVFMIMGMVLALCFRIRQEQAEQQALRGKAS